MDIDKINLENWLLSVFKLLNSATKKITPKNY